MPVKKSKAEILADELKCYQNIIQTTLTKMQSEITDIHTVLHSASVNGGQKGIINALHDIYIKLEELTQITKSSRTSLKMTEAWKEWREAKPWRKMLFSTKSYVALIMLFFTLHKLQIGSQSILNIIIEFFIK